MKYSSIVVYYNLFGSSTFNRGDYENSHDKRLIEQLIVHVSRFIKNQLIITDCVDDIIDYISISYTDSIIA
jgi:hypothetical protein